MKTYVYIVSITLDGIETNAKELTTKIEKRLGDGALFPLHAVSSQRVKVGINAIKQTTNA